MPLRSLTLLFSVTSTHIIYLLCSFTPLSFFLSFFLHLPLVSFPVWFPVMWWCSSHYQQGFDIDQWTIIRHNVWIKGLDWRRKQPQAEHNEHTKHVGAACRCRHSVCLHNTSVTVCCDIVWGVFLLRYFSLTHKGNSAFPEAVLILAPPQQLPCICIFGLQCPFDSVNCVLRKRTSAWPTRCRCNLRSCIS